MKITKLTLAYLLLTLGAITMLLPFVWMILTSLQPATAALTGPPLRLPHAWQWLNYSRAWHTAPFARYCLNSLLVTLLTTAGQVITSILAAFAFTHLRFYGRRLLFNGLIALMMVPGELLLIPNFVTMTRLHWVDTYAALIVPWLASIFAMFTLRQAFSGPTFTTYYAAKLDGASDWQYLWQILVPANRSTITAVAILQLIGSWNAFMWPLIITNSETLRTLPVGLVTFTSETGADYPLLMAATVFVILPLLILYLFLQKYIIAGITRANLKG
ncbi:carbohydrate ABC transporter permease [Levilactobacillus zymae]|uniref:carbohydrate ABC transporter permease n=1 Tax=Levilactobacillus zymae TaxID=267363 RepID=UPI0028B65801|nr:carbohydrate ABC transporter permease [Levilactobacillus zymae]MDT6980176.1 carbohydrate ABC transporter permease [Levilactobacillus zymae]